VQVQRYIREFPLQGGNHFFRGGYSFFSPFSHRIPRAGGPPRLVRLLPQRRSPSFIHRPPQYAAGFPVDRFLSRSFSSLEVTKRQPIRSAYVTSSNIFLRKLMSAERSVSTAYLALLFPQRFPCFARPLLVYRCIGTLI